MASTYLTRTHSSAGGGVYKWTYSFWVKRSALGECTITGAYFSNSYLSGIKFTSNDNLEVYDYRNSFSLQKVTNRKFRDTNGWFHIVVANDNSVSSPDTKIYVNGVEETSFSTDNEYSQNETNSFNNDYTNTIGSFNSGASQVFDGCLSHFHFIDGTAYDATAFGSVDNVTGQWKINTSPSVNYGTNGFFILKDGNSVTDQSGNGNNFTVGGGTLTKTEDCPSNVFATWNPLEPELSYKGTYSNGNTTVTTTTTGGTSLRGSIAIPYTGKWYWENKVVSTSGTIADNSRIGIATGDSVTVGSNVRYMSNGQKTVDASASSYGATYGAGDIIGVAVDSDNNTVEFFKNGASQGSISYTMDSSLTYKPYISENSNTISITFSTNFGNGYFGTTAVASAGTNASGNGIFEYDVPNGFTALSTKGLNL